MNKQEFFKQLKKKVAPLPKKEQLRITEYYTEMMEDQLEEGKSEEEIIESFGDMDSLLMKSTKEPSLSKLVKWVIAFPILLVLYLCALILDLSLWTISASFAITAIFALLSVLPYFINALSFLGRDPLITLFQTGGCILILGIGCFLTLGSYYCAIAGKQFFHYLMDSWKRVREGF